MEEIMNGVPVTVANESEQWHIYLSSWVLCPLRELPFRLPLPLAFAPVFTWDKESAIPLNEALTLARVVSSRVIGVARVSFSLAPTNLRTPVKASTGISDCLAFARTVRSTSVSLILVSN